MFRDRLPFLSENLRCIVNDSFQHCQLRVAIFGNIRIDHEEALANLVAWVSHQPLKNQVVKKGARVFDA